MATKMPKKDIDDIKTMKEMLELLQLLHIDYDQECCTLRELKKTAKEKIQERSSGNGEYSNGTTGFAVISKAKEEDMLQRDKLEEFYSKINDCLKRMDDNVISILNTYYKNREILNVFDEQRDRLKKRDYHILIAGESSAGKSSLLNLILGEELLPHHVLNATSTICELKFGEERQLVVHRKYDRDQKVKPLAECHPLESEDECGKSYQEQIASFVHLDSKEREKGSDYIKVEIFWPHELLEKGVVIIDTPGLGESDDMDQVLMNYLPNAFAFIYVIDISHAGGVQKDFQEKLMKILEKVQSLEGGDIEKCNRLAECSLFVCNKWDQVKENERDQVKGYVVKKLSECWQETNLNDQIVYMSINEAIEAQQYGGVTTEFNGLLQSINRMILKAINTRLYNHWQWLDLVLYLSFKLTYFFNREIKSTHHKTRERMNSIESRIEKIEEQEQKVSEELQIRLKDQTNFLFSKLDEYIHSSEFQKKFCMWASSSLPKDGNTWEITKKNVTKAMEDRFKELLFQWESENQIYTEIHRQLVHEFLARLNLIEEELEGVDKAMHGVEREVDYLNNRSQLSTSAKVLVGATIPLWVPVAVAGLVIGMPVLGAIAVRHKVSQKMKLDKYREDPHDYLEKRSKKFLASLTEEDVFKYAEKQMQKTNDILSKYSCQIPIVIEANRKMVSQLLNETRSQDEVLHLYVPIQQKSFEVRENMTPLGIELSPATVDARDLDWKEDMDSCLGGGEFSLVYRGKLRNGGRNTALDSNRSFNVAVKVFKQPFDYLNSRFYLNEEMKIRQLNHKNVLKFFGAMKVSISNPSKDYKFIFVRESCQANLRSVIFKDKSITPAKSSDHNRAIDMFLKWVTEIAEGLNYIHERGLVHRHLKLENILVNEDGTAKIADIGIVGQFLDTEKSIIYLAPEVLKDLKMRTKEADVYSYGIMLWEMWYGTQAFTELMPLDKATFQEKISDGYRPKIDYMTISVPGIHVIMALCWKSNANERPPAKKCYEEFQKILENRVGKTDNSSDQS